MILFIIPYPQSTSRS